MSLPKQIKIGPLTYTVNEAEPVLDDGDLIGESLHLKCIINIRSSLPQQMKELTFVHEVVHALMYVAGLPGGGDTRVDITAEDLTHRFALVLYQFLKDNGLWP